MKIKLVLCAILISNIVYAQKKNVDLETYKTWSEVDNGGLSNDGKIAFYTINNLPVGSSTFKIKSTVNDWETTMGPVNEAIFSKNSKYLVGKLTNDTLFIVDLITKQVEKIEGVQEFKLFTKGKSEMIALRFILDQRLMIRPMMKGKTLMWNNVARYTLSPDGKSILLKLVKSKNEEVQWINFDSGAINSIISGRGIEDLIYDDTGNQMAFIVRDSIGSEIWYCNKKDSQASLLVKDRQDGIPQNLQISNQNFQFSKDGQSIFFSLAEQASTNKSNQTNVQIWSYQDAYLKSYYYSSDGAKKNQANYLTIINTKSKKIIQLLHGYEILGGNSFSKETDSVIIIQSKFGDSFDPLDPSTNYQYSICFTRTGERIKFIDPSQKPISELRISPKSSFAIYYDYRYKNYFSYCIKTHQTINISDKVTESLLQYDKLNYPFPENFPAGCIAWLDGGSSLLINCMYNIWRLDLTGKSNPLNLTGNQNKLNNQVFGLASQFYISGDQIHQKKVILHSLNLYNKDLSFFSIDLNSVPRTKKLWEGAVFLTGLEYPYHEMSPNNLIISKKGQSYLIRKESVAEAPNYFYSNDLMNLKPISNNQPQTQYNWLRSELYHISDSGGIAYKGIVYKPEDFNPNKQYPILFKYYEDMSNLLNAFPKVDLPMADFSIATAVSQGYIVVLPDIVSKVGSIGEGALNSLLMATKYLSAKPWADTSKMGIAGHSFAGYETNYIVTHTNIFKAAVSGAGNSELVTAPLSIWGGDFGGDSRKAYIQNSAPKMLLSLTDDPDRYIKNSPLIKANMVSTPLLLMHNTGDNNVDYQQTRQFFILLRSLRKEVWWLNYVNEEHAILQLQNRLDYNQKVFGFLNHFLKGASIPEWMATHISPENQ